jgi:hypothetical protein
MKQQRTISNYADHADQRSMHRAITASVLEKLWHTDATKILKTSWGDDHRAMMILKAPVSPTATPSGYPSIDTIGVFRSLAPGSAALALFERCTKLNLQGINTVRVPHTNALPRKPVFIGEGKPAPAVQFPTAATTLGPTRKILVISAVSRESQEASAETASTVIGRVLADASNASIDFTAFDTNAADATRPAGLLYGVTPISSSNGSDDYMNMADDLGNLAKAVGDAMIDPSDLIYVAGPREATIIRLRGGVSVNCLTTLGLPAGSVAAFAPAAVYSGYQGEPVVETAEEVAIHMEDLNPAEIVSSPGTVAAPQKSFFQTEVIAIRVRAWASWAVAPGGAQIVNSVNW